MSDFGSDFDGGRSIDRESRLWGSTEGRLVCEFGDAVAAQKFIKFCVWMPSIKIKLTESVAEGRVKITLGFPESVSSKKISSVVEAFEGKVNHENER